MRSVNVLAFSGLAAAALIPAYDAPAPEVTSPAYELPAEETEYSTLLVTVTSCAPEVEDCPAESTVVSSSVVPLTTSTIYETKIHTVSECPEEVEDCPLTSGATEIVVTETIAVSTTVCPVDEVVPTPEPSGEAPYPPPTEEEPSKSVPEVPEESGEGEKPSYPPVHEEPTKSEVAYPPPQTTDEGVIPTAPAPPVDEEPLCPTESVKTITYSTEITTVIPTVLTKYETATLEVPCPEPTQPSASVPVYPPVAPSVPGNGTVPGVPVPSGPAEAGAAGVSGSVFVAALAAVAAFAFA